MGMTIKIFWKIFCCEIKIYQYKKLIGIRELSELLDIGCFNNPFTADTRTLKESITLLDELVGEDTFLIVVPLIFQLLLSLKTGQHYF